MDESSNVLKVRRKHAVVFIEGLTPVGYAIARALVEAEIGVLLLCDDRAIGPDDAGFSSVYWGRRRVTQVVAALEARSGTRVIEVPEGCGTVDVDLHILVVDQRRLDLPAPTQSLPSADMPATSEAEPWSSPPALPGPDNGATAVLPVQLSDDECVVGPLLGEGLGNCVRCYLMTWGIGGVVDPVLRTRTESVAAALTVGAVCSLVEAHRPGPELYARQQRFSAFGARLSQQSVVIDPECQCQTFAHSASYRKNAGERVRQ